MSHLLSLLHTKVLTGAPLAEIQEVTSPNDGFVSGNHREELAFYILKSPQILLV